MTDEVITVKGEKAPHTFEKRFLKFKIIGGVNNAGQRITLSGNKENSIEIEGLRATVDIQIMGARVLPTAFIEITNPPEYIANALSSVGLYSRESLLVTTKVIILAASIKSDDETPVYSQIFEGGILQSYMDYNAAPNPVLYIQIQTLADSLNKPSSSISFPGKVMAEDIVNKIVENEKRRINNPELEEVKKVINHDVNTALSNPNFYGSMWDQILKCKIAAGFEVSIQNKTLHMFPVNGGINIDKPLLMARTFGQFGYPQYSDGNIIVKCIFKPNILFGQAIQIIGSKFEPANGIWPSMISLKHNLTCMVPNGEWSTTLTMSKINSRQSS